jgi:Tol biopolymer transport system component
MHLNPQLAYVEYTKVGQPFRAAAVRSTQALRNNNKPSPTQASTRVRSVAVFAFALALALPAHAQYFGRNKVVYEQFDFKVLATDHFDIYYYPEEEAAVQLAARMAERWYVRLSKLLRHELSGRQPLILYAAHPHFQQTNTLAGEVGEGTGGVTEMFKRRIVLPFAGGLAETDHVLGHELVHAFQFDMATRRDAQGNLAGPAVMMLPLWFIEGMAEYLSIGSVDANTAMWIRDASSRDKMPNVDKLDDPNFFPYRYGHAFWAYVAGRWGDAAVGDMLRATGPQGDIEGAMKTVLGVDEDTLTREWHDATRRTYAPFFETTRPASSFGRAILTKEGSGGEINVGPALSPDGRRVVFLSERDLFSIDMFVADVATGRVQRTIVKTAGDPHFDSLQFLSSAGDWAPDNRRVVIAALSKGQPVLAIVDADTGRREREEEFPDIGEIFNPAWSPDGKRIAFSGLTGGVLDLYVWDLESGALQRLTNDPFADMDPEWSRDSRTLAFVTDRFSSDLAALEFGNYRIGSIDVASREARALAGFQTGRNTNPEFTADGSALYFIAAPDGIANIYRSDLDRGGVTRVTNVLSGVSGITPLTPALSVASASRGIVFTVFENDQYNIYATDTPATLAGVRVTPEDRSAAVLPPYSRTPSAVNTLLSTPTAGLPPPTQSTGEPYRARLSLDAIGQPAVGIGADRFGAYAAGGMSLMFSDMLGNHTVATSLQLTSRFQEIGGVVAYINRESRWNWGVVGEQTPYVTGAFAQGFTEIDGATRYVEQTHRITQINTGVSALAQYPFSRAHRVEFAGGVRRIGFDQDIETRVFSAVTGQLLDEQTEELPRPGALGLGEASTALVYDSSIFGATGPILGQRYRFEYSQVAGDLLYSGVLGDFRRYFMPLRPFTFAVRGLHYGRYGRDGEDERLSPLFLGYPGLVRGYEVPSFEPAECRADGTCPAFDDLLGSRMAIGTAELRFPLLGIFSRDSFYGPFPIELAFFGDAGVAWTSDTKPDFLGGDRNWARSVGAALRVNALGFAILEFDYVRPLDRPGRGWLWQFNMTPGF